VNASSLILQRRYAAAALVALIIAVFAMSSLSAWRTGQHASHLTALIESGLVTSPPPSVTQLQSLVLDLGNQITQHHQNETTSLLWAKRVFFVLALLALAWSLQLTKRLSRLAQEETERLKIASDQAIHALKITRDQLSELATASQDVFWVKDRQGVYTHCNALFERYVNRSREDIIGHTDADLSTPSQAANARQSDQIAIANGWFTRFEEWHLSSEQEERRLYEFTKTPLLDAQGQCQAVQCVGRDITLQRQAELKFEAANAQRLLLELCVAQLDDVVLIAEADLLDESNTHIVFVNDAMERVTGYKRSEVLGRSLSLLAGLQTGIQERDQIQTAMARGLPLNLELIHHRKDGTGYWTDLLLTPVTGTNGLLTHWISVHRDISARKQLDSDLQQMCDQALESSRLKSEFLATMSHEIRTPMNGVLGMVELLQSTALNHKQSLFLDALSQSAKGLMAIIDNILDFSAIEARALQMEQQVFDLQLWLNTCLNGIEAQVLTKQLVLLYRLDPALPSHLIGDARRLQQVLLALLDNAVKFTAAGRITVTLRPLAVTQAQAGVQWVRCEVQDTGIGLSRDNRRRLFQPFQQVDGSNARAFSGVGLSLALSHQLVALMHGHIGVDSEPGQGSTFWFEVPLALPPVALHIAA
jgi:PAS domain S-box-containing protein